MAQTSQPSRNFQRWVVVYFAIVDIFAIFDTNSRTNIEVYSNLFDATEEQVEKMLDIEYQIDK